MIYVITAQGCGVCAQLKKDIELLNLNNNFELIDINQIKMNIETLLKIKLISFAIPIFFIIQDNKKEELSGERILNFIRQKKNLSKIIEK